MPIIVQKYGGTSMGDLNKISHVADRIIESKAEGNKLVVVVSAMAGETDRLENLAYQISSAPAPRELDVLLATGEQVSIALLTMALVERGCKAKSYTGSQLQIVTTDEHSKARIIGIDKNKILRDLNDDCVVIVAGFQGVDSNNDITTLGRGGSDTTAVAIAATLKAHECQIFTDVQGVYTTDPKIVDDARKMDRVTFDEMLELSSLGAKVLQIRAVEFAGRVNVPIRVLSTFENGTGTLISYENENVDYNAVTGITFSKEEVRIIIRGVKDSPGIAGVILDPISAKNIEVDMILQNMEEDGSIDFTFTVHKRDYEQTKNIVEKLIKSLEIKDFITNTKIAKLSLVGVGIRSHTEIASKMFNVLGAGGINIKLISTSEIKVSVLIDEKYIELGVRLLHEAFGLDKHLIEQQNKENRLEPVPNG